MSKDKGKIVEAHTQVHTFTEVQEYPDHRQRSESAEYRHNHDLLIDELNLPCFVCDMLGLEKLKSEYLETHHYVIEWSEWNSASPKKVQKLFDDGVFDFYGYSKKLKGKKVESPDDIRNLLVLCPLHHRGDGIGIHESSAPMWTSQMVAKDGVEMLDGSIEKHNEKEVNKKRE